MSGEITERVLRSVRYRDIEPSLIERLAVEELPRSRNADDAVKRVKRRLHQVVGAFRGPVRRHALVDTWRGDLAGPAFRAACIDLMRTHASTRERIEHLEGFYPAIWRRTGVPATLLDLGCGLNPLALPWMGIRGATYLASDVDERPLAAVRGVLEIVGQPHEVRTLDLATRVPEQQADVALLLKLVPTLDRQDAAAATRLLRGLRVRHAVVSFATRSLGGRRGGMERTYRRRLDRLAVDAGRVRDVAEASVPNELVFVLTLDG
jgi:16S rRNA (guanine(1405)-N(7))-methyltransferase